MVGANRHHKVQSQVVESVDKGRVVAIDRVRQDHLEAEPEGQRLLDQGQGQLGLGLEAVTGLETCLGL